MNLPRQELRIVLLVCVASLIPMLVVYARQESPNRLQLTQSSQPIYEQIANLTPRGSDIHRAKSIMEENGFGCSVGEMSSRKKYSSFQEAIQSGQNLELQCSKKSGYFKIHYWEVDFSFDKNKITGFETEYRTEGLWQ